MLPQLLTWKEKTKEVLIKAVQKTTSEIKMVSLSPPFIRFLG